MPWMYLFSSKRQSIRAPYGCTTLVSYPVSRRNSQSVFTFAAYRMLPSTLKAPSKDDTNRREQWLHIGDSMAERRNQGLETGHILQAAQVQGLPYVWIQVQEGYSATNTEEISSPKRSLFVVWLHVCSLSQTMAFDAVRTWYSAEYFDEEALGEEALQIGHIQVNKVDDDRGLLLDFRRNWRLYAGLKCMRKAGNYDYYPWALR